MKVNRSALIGIMGGFIVALAVTFYLQHSPVISEAKDEKIVIKTTGFPSPNPSDVDLLKRESGVFNSIAKSVSASVVHITSEKTIKPIPQPNMPFDEDMLRKFFPEDRFGPFFKFGPQRPENRVGLGSGVIVGSEGYIVTNNHVIDGADKIKVMLPDGQEFSPQWVHTDPPSDLALIKINAQNLSALEFADSDRAQVGDIVLAVGNPFGLDNTVTQGIISYLGRSVPISSSTNYTNYIQTDAAINPGNSGGPLVDLSGQIVGLNTAIISNTSSYAGIGFAIPANTVKFVTDQLKKSESVTRSYLGVQIQNMTLPLAKNFGLENNKGALISDVRPNTPASKAGLAVGDVILKINNIPILNSQQLQNMIAVIPPGTDIKMELWRNKKLKEISVTLEKMSKGFLTKKNMPSKEEVPKENQATIKELGLVVASLNEELAQKYQYQNAQGVVVVEIDPQGDGAQAGLQLGDLIVTVQDQKVTSVEDLVRLLKKYPLRQGIAMLVRSAAGGSRYIYIKTD